MTRDNGQVYYQEFHISLPSTFTARVSHRTITGTEFLLSDPVAGDRVLVPMVAVPVRGRYIASYAIRGVQDSYASACWGTRQASGTAVNANRACRTSSQWTRRHGSSARSHARQRPRVVRSSVREVTTLHTGSLDYGNRKRFASINSKGHGLPW